MGEQTKIEWCDATWNPITGCTKISPACEHCYAERMSKRLAGRCGYPKDEPFRVTFHPERLAEPLAWKKPRRIFVCSMGDLFHDDVPRSAIYQVFGGMHHCRRHTYMLLTKRPQNMKAFLDWYMENPLGTREWPLPNVWLGVTAEDQQRADERIPLLLQCPAAVRFVSYEPALRPLSFRWANWCKPTLQPGETEWHLDGLRLIDWVIAGGETGPGARPMHPDWVRGVRDQCQAAGVPFFFKQWGEWMAIDKPWEQDNIKNLARNENWLNLAGGSGFHGEEVYRMRRIGKSKAGRELDGREWNEFPEEKP